MEFQVQKHRATGTPDPTNDIRAGAGKKLAAYFESSHNRRYLASQGQGSLLGWQVQSNKDGVTHGEIERENSAANKNGV
jgi:hypothetical protein